MKRLAVLILMLIALADWARAAETNDPAAVEAIEKHIAAIGGRDAWKAVKTVRESMTMEILGTPRTMERIEDRETQRFRMTTTTNNTVRVLGYDGTRVWETSPSSRGYLAETDPQTRSIRNRQKTLLEYKEHAHPYRRLADETIDGKQYLVISTTQLDPLGRDVPTRYYLDPATSLLARVVRGSEVPITTRYEDCRKVGNVMVAFTRINETPHGEMVTRVTEWQANVPVDAKLFAYDGPEGAASAPTVERKIETAAALRRTYGPNDEIPEALRIETFEHVWRKINGSYWDPTFGGVDWKKAHDELLPKVRAAKTSDELHKVLEELTGRLGRSHFRIIRPDRVMGVHTTRADARSMGRAGVRFRLLDGRVVVYGFEDDISPARDAGVRKGWIVEKIDGKTPQQIFDTYVAQHRGFQLRPEISRIRALNEALAGKVGKRVSIDFLDEQDQPRTVAFELAEEPKPDYDATHVTWKRLDEKTGYIKIDVFFGKAIKGFEEAVAALRDTERLIIDLRGNPGGAGDMAPAMAASLMPEAGSLGSMKFRYATNAMSYKPAAQPYRGKITILVDEWTGSTSEVFTAGLQEAGRATVIGTTTAGAVLPSLIEPIPTGAALQYVVSNFETPKGRVLEGAGVKPDVEARITRQSLLEGTDPVLEKAR